MSPKKGRLPPFPAVAPLVKRTILAATAAASLGACAAAPQPMPPQVVDPPQDDIMAPADAGDPEDVEYAKPPPPQVNRPPQPPPQPPPPPQVAPQVAPPQVVPPPEEDKKTPIAPQVAPPR